MSKRTDQLDTVNDRLHAMRETIEAEMGKAEKNGEEKIARKLGKASDMISSAMSIIDEIET